MGRIFHEAQLRCEKAHTARHIMPQKMFSGDLAVTCQNALALEISTTDGVCADCLGVGV